MPRKRRSSPKQIEASSIVLKDTDGKVRILLDAGGSNGYATIVMVTQNGRVGFEIGSQPDGHIAMSFSNAACTGTVTLSPLGLVVRDAERRLGVVIGNDALLPRDTPVADGAVCVAVYQDGALMWRPPVKKTRRSSSRQSSRSSKAKKSKR